jgi:isopenicillin-N epimerase
MELGYKIRENWNIDFEKIKFLNHGSFGATPIPILNKMHEIELLVEKEPVHFFMDIYPEMLEKNIRDLAGFLNTEYENLVLTDNATTGVNIILNNVIPTLAKNQVIFYTNHIYPAVRNTINHLIEKHEINSKEIIINYPNITKTGILESIEKALSFQSGILVIDHISSPTSVVFPIKEIIEICKKNNIRIIVDGAHAPGVLELQLKKLGADWYVGNCHKWMYSGKGTAFIHTSPENFEKMHPNTISNDYGYGYRKEFDWVGTRNPSSWLTLSDTIEFYNNIGFEQINNYNNNLLKYTVDTYFKEIKIPNEINLSNYSWLISLPFPYFADFSKDANVKLRNYFYNEYGIEIMFVIFEGKIWIRFAAQIYNTIAESEYLISKVKDFLIRNNLI